MAKIWKIFSRITFVSEGLVSTTGVKIDWDGIERGNIEHV